jgi:hypothetical protein
MRCHIDQLFSKNLNFAGVAQGCGPYGRWGRRFAAGNAPPFSFRLAEKKTAVHGQKKRR